MTEQFRTWRFQIVNGKTSKISTFYGKETAERNAEELLKGVMSRVRDETPIRELPQSWTILMNIVEEPVVERWPGVPRWVA